MKLYSKRVAFCISDQHLVPHGGIGQFAKSFTEMANRLRWKVDIIMDKPPTGGFSSIIEGFGALLTYPVTSNPYSEHTGIFAFSDSINFEKIINFRRALMYALSKNLYDMIICNSMESMPAALALDLGKNIPVVFYTHEESMVFRDTRKFKGVFTESCNEFFNKLMTIEYAFVGTQSQRNVDELKSNGCNNATLLPMPISELDLLKPNYKERSGVLYIGRWEERKNPEAFLEVIKKTGLPAKIITNGNGKKKFENRLAELGITDYEIRAGIIGKEKVDFIKSARVHFNPSLRENYPFTFFECMGHMPSIVIDKSEWITNFDKKFYGIVSMDKATDFVQKAYDNMNPKSWYEEGALTYVKKLHDSTEEKWVNFLNNYVSSSMSKSEAARINEYTTVKYLDFIKDLNRKCLAVEDIKSVLTNKHKYNIIYTDENTYLSKEKYFVPNEIKSTSSLENLFI
jgi:glycosyltransferase involved in cell wall biosynthesis